MVVVVDDVVEVVLVVVVVGATVVVVGVTVVVVVVVEVVVEVVVGGGITNPFAQPQRISIGAPRGMPAVAGIASSARRNCAHASHAEIPVVGQPPRTCVHKLCPFYIAFWRKFSSTSGTNLFASGVEILPM